MKFRFFLIPIYFLLSIHFISAVELPTKISQLEEYNELIRSQNDAQVSGDYGIPNSDTLFLPYEVSSEQSDTVKKYFGYDYFTNRSNSHPNYHPIGSLSVQVKWLY
jgi:hypothetical protein